MTYAPIIKFIQSSWYILCFCVFLQLIKLDNSNVFNRVSIALCFLTIAGFVLCSLFFFYKINFCRTEDKFDDKYDSLYFFYKQESFWARNFSFWIFIKKAVLMLALIVLYDWLYVGLIVMSSICAAFGVFIFFVKPYTLPRMNDYHIISEAFLIICFGIIYQIELCNVQINSNLSQSITQEIVAKKVIQANLL